ncbi:protein ZGRF1 [Pitangus sulphuratus]|nr:protein ZGRF1 [Pitangus sulphuratus]
MPGRGRLCEDVDICEINDCLDKAMASQEFTATLFDDKGQCLESIFLKSQVAAGDNLESERYLITVEEAKASEKPLEDRPRKAEIPAVDRNGVIPGLLPPRRLPVGLKRKFTGFQGPRQVEKKIPAVEEEGKPTPLPLSKQCQGTFPSQFYVTSPLFSTIHKKDADTNLSAGFQEDGWRDNAREHLSVSSLLSAPFPDRCEGTEKQSPAQLLEKPESPLGKTESPTGQTGPRAVSHNIRSTAQIIALLKSKPAQGHGEQTPALTQSLSRFQAAKNADLWDQKSTALPAFPGDAAKGIVPNTQHPPFRKGTVNDRKDWNAEMPLNSPEQPYAEEAPGQRHNKKVNNLSQDLQDPCNTNSCFLPESTVSRMSDSQFVPSSGDISPSASPITLENNAFGYREQSGTKDLRENSSVKMQSELQPRQNSEGVPSDLELSGDVTLTEAGIVKEELSLHGKECSPDGELMEVNFNLLESFDFNDTDSEDACEGAVKQLTEGNTLSQSPDCCEGGDGAPNAVLTPHSRCGGVTHSKNEAKCSTLDRESDGSDCTGGVLPELCANSVRDTRGAAEDPANQSRTEVELLGGGHNIKEMNESQLSIEATSHKEDLAGCAALTISGTPWTRNQHSDSMPGDTNVKECHPETSAFEATGNITGISPSRIISATAKEGVTQLGCRESPAVGSEHLWGSRSDGIKPGSPLLALSPKSDLGSGSFQSVAEDHQKVFGISHKEDALISLSSLHPLGTGHSSPEGTAIAETEVEDAESVSAPPAACKGERGGVDSLKGTAVTENSPGLPALVNDIALLRALTQHSTALESLQKMEENTSMFRETEASKETFEPLGKDEAIKEFTEMPYSESLQASSCSYFDSSGLMPVVFQGHQVKGSAASEIMLRAPCSQLGQQQYPHNMDFAAETFFSPLFSSNNGLFDFGQSPGSRSLQGDDMDVIREGNFQMEPDVMEESRINQSPLAFHVYPEVPAWTMAGSPSHSALRQAQWTSWEPGKDIRISELSFPSGDKVKRANLPKRKISIPAVFRSHIHYKQIFKAALTEQLNIMLFELSQRLHNALSKVDISFYTSVKDGQSQSQGSCAPLCNHMHPAKLVMVKKEGQNKGRLFYACDAPKAEQCSFFKWIEDVNPTQAKSSPSAVLRDVKSIGTYLRSQRIALYEECQLLVRKAFEIQTQRYSKFKKFMNTPASLDGDSKPKLYLKLSKKEHSSLYSKDDIWVVSKTLNFDPIDTFIASSAFFGPSSNSEIELLPLKGYSPSNWRSNMCVHALLVCNASGELASLRNMEEHFNPSTLPLIPYLLNMNFRSENAPKRVDRRKFTPPAMRLKSSVMAGPVSSEVAEGLAEEMIQRFSLNPDQATSLLHIARMMSSCGNITPEEEQQSPPVTIIRGVFGAGKSYLLSVVILFLVQLFESSEATEGPRPTPWKLLIASSTNVAVDRILLGLLELGFEDFIRVGSIRKITKAILPHSLHAGSGNENEQLKELLALMKEDLTPAEKIYVRKSIEQHKLGTNKTILQQVKVVGVTCAACPFPCLNALRFPVVMLDECSQMTEPASLLPIARFQCEKLVLVGDPKQLPPTIQGSESVHEQGLEQTLFDRLCLMGHKAILLRTQYRCHPALSAIANELFYGGNLIDGISEEDRAPLLDWLPTLCFYSVNGMEQIERDNSFSNMAEAHFAVKLIQALIASGIEGAAIGVITLYKSQMYKIQSLLSGVHSEAFEVKPVQVSTVDAFQGAEKEIIVLSCVRTRQFGFIDSEKRMNVALTRAKRHLLILGNLACLSRNKLWGRVIHHCKGWENGLQNANQCEQQLNDILKCYWEERKEEEQSKREK